MTRRVDIGLVVRRTFATCSFHAGPLLLLVAASGAIVWAIGPLMERWVAESITQPTFPFASLQSVRSPAFWAGVVTSAVFNALVLMIVLAPNSADRPVRTRLQLMGRAFPTVLVVICLASLGGLIYAIPGYLIAVLLAVAGPAAVVENLSLKKAILRNYELTRNNRFGIFLIGIIGMFVSAVWFALSSFVSNPLTVWVSHIAIDHVVSGVSAVMFITGSAVLYQELRVLHEGMEDDDISAVFD